MSTPGKTAAFTLTELLVVMGVMVLMIALVVPAIGPIMRGNNVTQAIESVEGQLELARQTAITTNRVVEVRFYQYVDPNKSAARASFGALQIFGSGKSNLLVPTGKVQTLPGALIMDSGATLSSLLDPAKRTRVVGPTALASVGTNYSYVALRFRPDGSTDLLPTGGPWFMTLHDALKGDNLSAPPTNFGTIEIDPVNGTLKLYRQ